MIVCLEEDAMTKKRVGPPSNLPEASSAMGPIARGLIEENLGPDHRVIDIERFSPGSCRPSMRLKGGETGAT
jgi:hypothetical protein